MILALDSLGLTLAAYLIAILALGILAGKALKANRRRYYPRERVGFDLPTPMERHRAERDAAARRGEVHAARARRRRLDAMERERAVYEDREERAS